MRNSFQHRLFIGITAVIVLIFGIFIGDYLATNLAGDVTIVSLEAIKIGLLFTTIILLLIVGSLILEIKDITQVNQHTRKDIAQARKK